MNYLTSDNIEDLRKVINEALKNVEGVDFTVGKIRYNSESAQIALEAIVSGGRSKIEQALEDAMTYNQITNTKFIVSGREFNLVGYKKANWKYPFIATDKSLRKFKFSLESVMQGQINRTEEIVAARDFASEMAKLGRF